MRYMQFLDEEIRDKLFAYQPDAFSKASPREQLRTTVGALLYTPGTNQSIADIVLSGRFPPLASLAVCLEDAVGDSERAAAVANLRRQLSILSAKAGDTDSLPLIFVRVKDFGMLEELADMLAGYSRILTGVILPKATPAFLDRALPLVRQISGEPPFYAMPILESPELMESTDRIALLHAIRERTDRFFEHILGIRVGVTDLCGLYGIRRRVDTPVYHIGAAAACLADIVRVFGLRDRYTISGPVWEYFSPSPDTPEMAGLIRETCLDQQNGFLGKTCAHPSQLLPVQGCCVVPWETYADATAVLSGDRDHLGVLPSLGKNKMNELKPHAIWAGKIMQQARFYGVFRPGVGINDLLKACEI